MGSEMCIRDRLRTGSPFVKEVVAVPTVLRKLSKVYGKIVHFRDFLWKDEFLFPIDLKVFIKFGTDV